MSPLTGFTQKQTQVSRFSPTLQRLTWHRPSSRGRVTPASQWSEPEVTPGRCCLNTNTHSSTATDWEFKDDTLRTTAGYWGLRAGVCVCVCVCVCVYGPENKGLYKKRDVLKPKTRVSTADVLDKHNPESSLSNVQCWSSGCCLRSNLNTWASVCCRLILT